VKSELEGIKNLSPTLYHCQSTIHRRRKCCRHGCHLPVITNYSNWSWYWREQRHHSTIVLMRCLPSHSFRHLHGNKPQFVLLR